jgi:parallel beta-helix repeat protein
MATFVVTSTADGGAGSLRDAIDLANAMAGDDTIQLTAGLTYTLTIAGAGEDLNATGDLDITAAEGLVIEAIGVGNATIDASGLGNDRIFDVLNPGATLSIDNLTLTGGNVTAAGEDGGAIDLISGATLNVTDSEISNNTADDNGGGIAGDVGNTITITNSLITGNEAAGSDGGGVYTDDNGNVTVTNSTISNNTANYDGGGIHFDDDGTLTISDSTVSGNTSGTEGGGIHLDNDGTAMVTRTTVSGNNADQDGGGLYFDARADLTITDSTISGNTTTDEGGGLEVEEDSTVTISNSTFSGNSTDYAGGGVNGDGSGIVFNISNSTIAFNTTNSNGGGINVDGGTLNIDNTIVATNVSGDGDNDIDSGGGTINSGGFNLIGDNTGVVAEFPAGNPNANNDIVGTAAAPIDPLLGPLADNGGPTETHELLAGSPALDAGDPAFMTPPEFDQRGMGFPRIVNAVVDIGAFEAQIGDLVVDKGPAHAGADLTPLPGEQITYSIEVTVDGAANISDLSIEDIFPAELVGVEWSFTDSAGTPFMGMDDIEVDGVVLNAGDTITVTATGYLDCDLTSGSVIENTATVAIGGGDMDENPANNSDTDTSFSISANSPGVSAFGSFLSGTAGNDVIIGNATNQTINGNFGNDSLYGSGGNDQINGGFGDDLLVGGSGDDQISGGVGNDTLDGACTTLGVGQIDRLTGNGGFDYFILGNELGAFYLGNGNQDFAYITDFNPGVDTIQLNGMLGDYTFMQTTVFANGINISGQGIFQGGDLVAILQQSSANPGDLVFVP